MKNPNMEIPVFGNGDVDSPEKALEMKQKYNVDGVMIGRASVGNPWLFRNVKHFLNTGEILPEPDINEKIDVCLKHLEYSIKWKGEKRSLIETRKHYSNYLKGIKYIKPYRIRLLTAPELDEVYEILEEIRNDFKS